MTRVPIHNIGSVGIIKDVSGHLLPPEAWTDGNNVRFRDGQVSRFEGHGEIFGTPSVDPWFTISVPDAAQVYWIYTSLLKAFVYQGGDHSDITRESGGDYSATNGRDWNGTVIGGVLVLNNGTDVPQYWPAINTATPLDALDAWPEGTTARVIRTFRNFLIALNVTSEGEQFPHRVLWSHGADPGTLPNSWDHTDPTKDAGINDLSDVNAGSIRDGQTLRDFFVIYKDESTWVVRFIGGQYIFQWNNVLTTSGILAPRCAAPVDKGLYNFVHTGDDLIRFDGQNAESILDTRWRKFLNNDIDSENFRNCFAADNPTRGEAWFCYPESGAELPTKALIWNYVENTISNRGFNGTGLAQGVIEELQEGTWDDDNQAWDNDEDPWARALRRQLLINDPTNTKFFQLDTGRTFNGVVFQSFVERTGLAIYGEDRQGRPKVDTGIRKTANRIWPKVVGGPIEVQLGAQEDLDDDVVWASAQLFDPANGDRYLDFDGVNGRLIAVRFQNPAGSDNSWTLEGYDLNVEVLGEH